MSKHTLEITLSCKEDRLDRALSAHTALSRTTIQRLIRGGCVVKADDPSVPLAVRSAVVAGEVYRVTLPEVQSSHLEAEDIDFEIVFEDACLLVVNKPAGLVVHPAPGHHKGTLVHGLLKKCTHLSGIGGVARPGIVHRLDKGTSGLMVVAKTDEAHHFLSHQLQERTLGRLYQALVWGCLKPARGTIEAPLGRHPVNRQKQAVREKGRFAKTFYQTCGVLKEAKVTHVMCRLFTGRTHQIRVHLADKGHALLGDPLYGVRQSAAKKNILKELWPHARPALHASHLYFVHPLTKKTCFFMAPLPADWQHLDLAMPVVKEAELF